MFRWEKKGIVYSPNGEHKWMYSHAQCPYPVDFDEYVRVYFCTREKYENNMCRAFGGFVDLDKNNLKNIINISKEPILPLGGVGEFDEYGSMPGSMVKCGKEYYLYYCGWTRTVSTPYNWAIGFAKSRDGIKFKRMGRGPLIGPCLDEPFLQASPMVYKFSENDWHMFYLSGIRWLQGKEKMESQYVLMHATSTDGVYWKRNAKPILPEAVEYESQTSCSIIKIDNGYHMFFSYRHGLDFRKTYGRGYQIGYAFSEDLHNWERNDEKAGFLLSEEGWDSKMVAYPHVMKINNKYIMFYCGNDFGKEGFGYAELKM